jgi:hypothetical protein
LRQNRILPIIAIDRQCHPLLCSSVLGPRAALRSCTEISSGGVVRNQSGAAPERKMIISAFRDRTSIAGRHRRKSKKSGSIQRRVKNPILKYDRTLPINQNDSGGTDPTRSSKKVDLAFQHAMRRAIARGLEHPPMIGVYKDIRPLNAPQLFDPVPHSSGCTSPALECAELMAHSD